MRKYVRMTLLAVCFSLTVFPSGNANAAVPLAILEIIKAGIKKVIKAVDLQVQRLQNKTIWLQNAQKVLENHLSKLKLDEIADWTEKQKDQYKIYFEELSKVKMTISRYQRIKEITEKQANLVKVYSRTWQSISSDKNFTAKELEYMSQVYSGIMDQSIRNVEQILLVVRSFSLQMSDAKRIELLNETADKVDQNYNDLVKFNNQNIMLSMQRANSQAEVDVIRRLYGISK